MHRLEAVAEALHLGLTMPLDERQDRWRRLLAQVKERDVVQWQQSFVRSLARQPAPAGADAHE
jgi:trehalose 6-phosphate synthase